MEVRVREIGNEKVKTIYVRIPKKIVDILKLTKRDWFEVELKDNKIIFKLERK